ncbi:helix-turn-helix domain-containing protein [Microbacterium lacus]
MPRVAQPNGSEEAQEPVALLGNLIRTSVLRFLRANPDATSASISEALGVRSTTIHAYLSDLERAGLVIADPPNMGERRGIWVKYRANDEAITDLYLRLGLAIGEF